MISTTHSLLSPMVLCFVLGLVAAALRSDLRIPGQVYKILSVYLLLAVGLKGGRLIAISDAATFLAPMLATVVIGSLIPIWCFLALRFLVRLSVVDSAAVAAHYGSVSAVTFAAGVSFLESGGIKYEAYFPALVGVLEVPGIVVALLLAPLFGVATKGGVGQALRKLLSSKSILLLLGGNVIGYLSSESAMAQVAPVFEGLFKGLLCFFLLELGLIVGRRFRDVIKLPIGMVIFALIVPLIHGVLGITIGRALGVSFGGAFLYALLLSSASYIAAPAAVRECLKGADSVTYISTSLGITFPFNIIAGLPIYFWLAEHFYR